MKKPWQLKRGDKARHGDELLTFNKMDGMFVQWVDSKGEICIGHSDYYELGEDGIYIPKSK